MQYEVLLYDWKESVNSLVEDLEKREAPVFVQGVETGSDSFAVVITYTKITKEEANKLFKQWEEEQI